MSVVRGFVLVVSLCLLWQLFVVLLQFPAYILPSPVDVLITFYKQFSLLISHFIPTFIETITGLILGIMLGIMLALLMTVSSVIRYWLLPLIVMSQAIPVFAVAPILVMWLGYGLSSKIVTTMLMLFFPVASGFFDGLQTVNQPWADMATVMNGRRLNTLLYLKIPAAVPRLASGIRVATVLAPLGAIVSEWIGSSKGLGFLMLNANARLDISLMFACVVLIMMMALLLYALVNHLLIKMIYWKPL